MNMLEYQEETLEADSLTLEKCHQLNVLGRREFPEDNESKNGSAPAYVDPESGYAVREQSHMVPGKKVL